MFGNLFQANQSLEHQERLAQLRTDLLKEQDEICQENGDLKTKIDHLEALHEDAARESSDLRNKVSGCSCNALRKQGNTLGSPIEVSSENIIRTATKIHFQRKL